MNSDTESEDIEINKDCEMNNWNNGIEDNVISIKNNCNKLKTIHHKHSIFIHNIYKKIILLLLFISPISGSTTFISNFLSIKCNIYTELMATMFSFFSTGIIFILKVKNIQAKVINHRLSSTKFHILEYNIERQLLLERKDRMNGKNYLLWVNQNFDEIESSTPSLPIKEKPTIIESFRKIQSTPAIEEPDVKNKLFEYELSRFLN